MALKLITNRKLSRWPGRIPYHGYGDDISDYSPPYADEYGPTTAPETQTAIDSGPGANEYTPGAKYSPETMPDADRAALAVKLAATNNTAGQDTTMKSLDAPVSKLAPNAPSALDTALSKSIEMLTTVGGTLLAKNLLAPKTTEAAQKAQSSYLNTLFPGGTATPSTGISSFLPYILIAGGGFALYMFLQSQHKKESAPLTEDQQDRLDRKERQARIDRQERQDKLDAQDRADREKKDAETPALKGYRRYY